MSRAAVAAVAAAIATLACGRPIGDPNNQAPTANAGPDVLGVPGVAVTFDAGGSSDADGEIVTFGWDFGDGERAEGAGGDGRAQHAWVAPGGYVVTLTVIDDDGAESTDEAIVTVEAERPVARFTVSPDAPRALEPAWFDASTSSGPAPITAVSWSFGDGTPGIDGGLGAAVEHTFAEPGTFAVTLTVVDDTGASAELRRDVVVAAQDIAGTYDLSVAPASYDCGNYAAVFPDSALSLAVVGEAITASGADGRTYQGTLEGTQLVLDELTTLPTGGGCPDAPVALGLRGSFTAAGAFDANATAYYDLGVGCQCSAVFAVTAVRR